MHVTFVKKILADGSACRKCADIEARLRSAGLWPRIDAVAVADERDPHSEGWALARRFDVSAAPFFVVRDGDTTRVYTIYLQFVREILAPALPPGA
ncbi:MAG: hypothetical protein AB7O21_13705 [Gammaproteobacteria bacterium]